MSKIAVLGFGVVGSGTVEVFYKNKENLEHKAGQELDIKYILDLKDHPDSPYNNKFIKDFNIIVNDPEISVVAELIGGNTFAYDFVKRSLLAGKSVVTSNKELVATKGAELLRIAKEKSVHFFFEASVGGGIPIIRPLSQCLMTDKIHKIAGILNGTTNFILTKMARENISFEPALKTAQELGYAERNPTADIDGHDTCRKICILASMVYGKHIDPDKIYTEGITKITVADIKYAESIHHNIKLIGQAEIHDDRVSLAVCPMLVSENSQLSSVNDVFNAILVQGDATGEVLFYGKGAGKFPTASAVVSDIINAFKPTDRIKNLLWKEKEEHEPEFIENFYSSKNSFYLRIKNPSLEELNRLFGKVAFLNNGSLNSEEAAIITDEMSEIDIKEKTKNLDILSKIRIFK